MRRLARFSPALLLILPACDLEVDPPSRILWSATLQAESSSGISGNAAAITYSNRTETGIGIAHAPESTTYRWQIRQGRCDAPGANVGPESAYPLLTTGTTGTAAANTILSARLLSGQDYHVVVLTEGDRVTVACGNFEET